MGPLGTPDGVIELGASGPPNPGLAFELEDSSLELGMLVAGELTLGELNRLVKLGDASLELGA